MIIFVVPAYNEEKNIGLLIDETHVYAQREKMDYRLVVVDDGSGDGTASIVREKSAKLPCVLVSYQPNRGVGEAFRQGMKKALELAKPGDVIVTKEADRTSDLNILKKLIAKLDAGADVALASCYAKDGGIIGTTWPRMFLSRSANFLIYAVFHIKGVHTYSSFYRAYRPAALQSVLQRYGDFYEEKGFVCVVELLVRLSRLRMKIVEVPMVLQSNQRIGQSKMKIGKTTLGYFRIMLRNAFRKL